MDLAQLVLSVFQLINPEVVQIGQKILDGVAQALDPNSQLMEGDARSVSQSALVQSVSLRPAFERHVTEDDAVGFDSVSTLWEGGAPALPMFAIKFVERCSGKVFQARLPLGCMGCERFADWVIGRGEFL